MRGLLRVLVVVFTVVSLMLVAAVVVSASSGKSGTSKAVKNSVVAVFSGQSQQVATLSNSTAAVTNSVVSLFSGQSAQASSHGDPGGGGQGNGGNNGGNHGDKCKPAKTHHSHATGDHENDHCGGRGDDSGSSG